MSEIETFKKQCADEIAAQGANSRLNNLTQQWFLASAEAKYSYHFTALGRPVIQYPQDMIAMQELIWSVRPDLIIETGIAHGGSLMLSASVLALIEYCDAIESGIVLDPSKPQRRVIGLDIDIRPHNREAIESHPMSNRIDMIEGSSIDRDIIAEVHRRADGFKKIMVILDSNHTHDHVLAELNAYSDLTTVGSYCVVFDTVIEDMLPGSFPNRPWDKGNNPKTAVYEFLKARPEFEIDKVIDHKLLISVAPDGFLRRVR